MQYTGSSFSQMLMELFSWVVWPKIHLPRFAGLFPKPGKFKFYVPDVVLDRLVLPGFRLVAHFFAWLPLVLRGRIQADILFVFLMVIALFLCG